MIKFYRGLNLTVERGERTYWSAEWRRQVHVAEILAGVGAIQKGERDLGHNAKIVTSPASQPNTLDPERTVLEELSPARRFARARRWCARSFNVPQGRHLQEDRRCSAVAKKSRLNLIKFLVIRRPPAHGRADDASGLHTGSRSRSRWNLRRHASSSFPTTCISSGDRDEVLHVNAVRSRPTLAARYSWRKTGGVEDEPRALTAA